MTDTITAKLEEFPQVENVYQTDLPETVYVIETDIKRGLNLSGLHEEHSFEVFDVHAEPKEGLMFILIEMK